ncbi:MAG: translation elongation factor Ts [Alphaproteobacteria bacterium]
MAEITAALVKQLREKTGAGMMDCKKALAENDGDIEAAVDWLRKKGLAAAAKKAGRVAADGLVGVAARGAVGALVEVNAETDFVARNEQFQAFVARAVELALDVDGVDALLAADFGGGVSVADTLTNLIATIGENMTVRRMHKLSVPEGAVAVYMHSAVAPGLGKIGVLVGLQSGAATDMLAGLGKQIAMHVAAANPLVAAREDLQPEQVERERAVLRDQAREQGKPENIIEKMIEGRMRKFFEDVVLTEQAFIMDTDKTVGAVVEAAAKDAGTPIRVAGFAKFVLGEGIDKGEDDFAAEVAKLAG